MSDQMPLDQQPWGQKYLLQNRRRRARHAKSSVEVQAGLDENLIEGANAPHNPDADDGLAVTGTTKSNKTVLLLAKL